MSFGTVVFDAYGTLFDVAGAARIAAREDGHSALAQHWPGLAETWRRKQLEYTWIRAITGRHADFATVTADALDWTLASLRIDDAMLRARLLALYDHLPAYPEVKPSLGLARERGARLAILSNGTPEMLRRATTAAGIDDLFAAVLSVEEVGIYKPHSSVYDLVERHLNVPAQKVLFVSSNGWDIAGAGAFGFRTLWINRGELPVDRLPHWPDHRAPDLTALASLVGPS